MHTPIRQRSRLSGIGVACWNSTDFVPLSMFSNAHRRSGFDTDVPRRVSRRVCLGVALSVGSQARSSFIECPHPSTGFAITRRGVYSGPARRRFESRVADVTEPPLRTSAQTPPQQLSNQSAVRRQRAPRWRAFKNRRNRRGERIAEEGDVASCLSCSEQLDSTDASSVLTDETLAGSVIGIVRFA